MCRNIVDIHAHTHSAQSAPGRAVSFVGSLTLTFIARDNNNVIKEKYNLILLFILCTNGVAFTRLLGPHSSAICSSMACLCSPSSTGVRPAGGPAAWHMLYKSRALVRPLSTFTALHPWGGISVHFCIERMKLTIYEFSALAGILCKLSIHIRTICDM